MKKLIIMLFVVAFFAACSKETNTPLSFSSKTGEMIIAPQFDDANNFSGGLASIRIGDEKTGKYGFIDKEGKIVINPQFDYASAFSEGLASIRIGDEKTGKYGFIDKEGKIVINPQFDWVASFNVQENLIPVTVTQNGKKVMGYISR